MKRFSLYFLLICTSLSVYGQSNYEKVNCELNVLRSWEDESRSCLRLQGGKSVGSGLKAVAECSEKAAKTYVRNSCMPSLGMVVNNYSILWQQLKIINQQYMNKQVSYDRAGSQSVMLLQMLVEQQDDYSNMLQSQIRTIRADEAEKSSRQFLRLALSGLEIVNKNGQALVPTNMTYILNGKVYNCSTLGSITNCM